MHIVIMGCGRVGSTLAHILEDRGNSVAVIDRDPEAFRRLRPSFKGDRVTGIGFDRDVLARAGIERADGFAAVSSGDNSNIIAARVARETFARPAGRRADLRPAARRGLRAARHPDGRDRALDGRPDAAQADTGEYRAAVAGRDRQGRAQPGERVPRLDRRAGEARRGVGEPPGSCTSTGSARRSSRSREPCCSRETWCTSSSRSPTSTGSAARSPSAMGGVTDAGRHRRGGSRGQVHRPRAARERP